MYPCFFDSQALLTTPRSSYYGPSLHPYAWLRSPEKEHKWQELLKKEYCSSQMIEIVRETNLITDQAKINITRRLIHLLSYKVHSFCIILMEYHNQPSLIVQMNLPAKSTHQFLVQRRTLAQKFIPLASGRDIWLRLSYTNFYARVLCIYQYFYLFFRIIYK